VQDAVVLPDYLTERPSFSVRRWNTFYALQTVLTRLGNELQVDAHAWHDYVLAKCAPFTADAEVYLIEGLNELATPEFLAKVFALANLHRSRSRA
jgi:hypothetical protein